MDGFSGYESEFDNSNVSARSPLKILYFTNPEPDYLADSFFLGLNAQPGITVYQSAVKEALYTSYPMDKNLYGRGFTLYRLLNDATSLEADISALKHDPTFFDLVIFSSIQRQFIEFKKYRRLFDNVPIWVLDGEDTPAPYPYHGQFWRKPRWWFLPKAHKKCIYFKRELTPLTISYLHYRFIGEAIAARLPIPRNFRPISFSIPSSKIVSEAPIKSKIFPIHIVDKEVADHLSSATTIYAFDTEELYYEDLRLSKYGITTKRAGWDCMRHYEIAANGAVICFRDLDQKPTICAPHGLLDGVNCINYSSYEDLKRRIDRIDDAQYAELQARSLAWVREHSCEVLVAQILSQELEASSLYQKERSIWAGPHNLSNR